MAGFTGWAQGVLRGIGAPATPGNLKFLNAWQQAEGGGASFNPLNTTQPAGGAGSYNSVGVRNYRSPQQGVQATVRTLLNGHYDEIVSGMRSGAHPAQLAAAVGASPWGTSGATIASVLGSSPGVTVPTAKVPSQVVPSVTIPSSKAPGPPNLTAFALDTLNRNLSPSAELSSLVSSVAGQPS